ASVLGEFQGDDFVTAAPSRLVETRFRSVDQLRNYIFAVEFMPGNGLSYRYTRRKLHSTPQRPHVADCFLQFLGKRPSTSERRIRQYNGKRPGSVLHRKVCLAHQRLHSLAKLLHEMVERTFPLLPQ